VQGGEFVVVESAHGMSCRIDIFSQITGLFLYRKKEQKSMVLRIQGQNCDAFRPQGGASRQGWFDRLTMTMEMSS